MKELIFGIKDIFNKEDKEGCLTQYESQGYHIPAYQRGYKWSSDTNGQVSILLNDLWESFERDESKEYYLQYITVKRIQVDEEGRICYYLEVIDGQQRLTTLSILLSVLALQLEEKNICTSKLHYAIREDFFSEHIYEGENLKVLVEKKWKIDFEGTDNDKQDIYYLFHAAIKCYSFFKNNKSKLDSFYQYLLKNVKLIVNSVDKHIESETVFKNLNSNKVPLSEVELIKGLLLTKVGRIYTAERRRSYKEVLDTRAALGKQWDEITAWTNKPEINTFYFNGKEGAGMHELLHLVAISICEGVNIKSSKKNDLPLFNFYNKYPDIQRAFQHLLDIRSSLVDWYETPKYYNLIGFCRFVKGSKHNTLHFLRDCFNCKDKDVLGVLLAKCKAELLPCKEINLNNIRYGEHDNLMHAILLSLSVFSKGGNPKFNFYEFENKQWTLEHIFPQSPEGKGSVPLSPDKKDAIRKMLGEPLSEEIAIILEKEEREDSEKQLYYSALKAKGILDSIGNMCLLTNTDNISVSCGFFKEKRQDILELIQNGSFVPKHSFDVFSKMIKGLEGDSLETWTKEDIDKHINYIEKELES